MNVTASLASLALLPGIAWAAPQGYTFSDPEPFDGPISTDRPSFGAGTRAVPIGRFQIEAGYTVTEASGDVSHTFPNTGVRFGILEGVEARVSTAGFVWGEGTEDGHTDLLVGARYEALDEDGWIPELAVQPAISVPVGDVSPSDSWNPEIVIPMAWTVVERTGVLVNVGAYVQRVDARRTTEVNAVTSILLGHALTDRFSVFGEYFAIYPGGASAQHSFDFGGAWLQNDNLQFDGAVGFGVDDDAADVFATVGVALRF